MKPNYEYLDPVNKKRVLIHVKQIYDGFNTGACVSKTIAEKYNAWKNFIDKRLPMSFNVNESMECFKDE